MRDAIIKMYKLTDKEVHWMESFAVGLGPKRRCDAINVSADREKAIAGEVRRKTNSQSDPLLKKLAQWLLTGERPVFDEDTPEVWLCPDEPTGCAEAKPIGEFPMWPIDSRCGSCIATRVDTLKTYMKRRKTEKAVEGILKNLHQQTVQLPHVSKVIMGVVKLDGGLEEFIKQWHFQLKAAREAHVGSKFVTDAYRDIVRLWKDVCQAEAHTLDVAGMDEAQTRTYLANLLMAEMAKQGTDTLLQLYGGEDRGDEVEGGGPSQEAG